jgi:hypothetical protein
MKLVAYLEDSIENITTNPNKKIIKFINRNIPRADDVLKKIDFLLFKSEIIPNVSTIDRIIILSNELKNYNISTEFKTRYPDLIKDYVNSLKINLKEYLSNVDSKDTNLEGENALNMIMLLYDAYSIFRLLSNIKDSEPNLDENQIKKIDDSIEIATGFFENNEKLLDFFIEKNTYFKKTPDPIKNSKISPIALTIKSQNKKYNDNVKLLKNKQHYYFKYNQKEDNYFVVLIEPHFDTFDPTYYDFALREGSKAGVYEFFDSPLIKSTKDVKFNKILFDSLNREKNQKIILEKIYLVKDPNKILDKKFKKISEIIAEKNQNLNLKLKFQVNNTYKLPANIKIGVITIV